MTGYRDETHHLSGGRPAHSKLADASAIHPQTARPGALIVVDKVIRGGGVLDAHSGDPAIQGTRRLFDMLAEEPRLDATAIQTVGLKDWDGFVIAVVK